MTGYLSVWMFSGALLLCAPEAISFFYSSEYISGTPIFIIYILDGMINFASFHLVIAAKGNSKYLMRISLSLLLANIVFSLGSFYLFNMFGLAMLGPAVATLVISIAYTLLLCGKTSKILEISIRSFLPIKSMVLYLCELIVVGGVFMLLKLGLKRANSPWFLILFIICVFYCLVVAVLNIKKYKALFYEINQIKQGDL